MKISTLRCELNTEELAPMDVMAQIGNMKYLWQVLIDDVLITKRAMPIGPYDHWIELEADKEYPIRGDGYRYVWVRQAGEYVVWFRPLTGYLFGGFHPGLEDNEVYVFEPTQYQQAVLACIYQDSPSVHETVQSSNAELKHLDDFELSEILSRSLPDESDPIYTVPELPIDQSGRKLVLRAKRHLVDAPQRRYRAEAPLRDVQLCNPPEEFIEVQIGLDLIFDFPESIWRFGKVGQGIAVCFMSRPCFPVWICGEQIDEAFADLVSDLFTRPA